MGKRKRNAELEEELAALRTKLSAQHTYPSENSTTTSTNNHATASKNASQLEDHIESHEVVGALMDMKTGIETRSRKLEDVFLSGDQVQELFDLYESTNSGVCLCHVNELRQILPLLSTVPTFSRLRQASKWILRSKSPPILDDSCYRS